jgi:thymidylate synthase (FAD)|tara:strand:- start:517 stop:1149 length:633 start_codon:yes stop_codon:yes gene_type:complete
MHSAKLVWITPNAESLVGKIARVSNPNNEDNPEVEKLIKYLIKHKHWSPFEMASMCVQIDTTRAISPQILRHRSFTFQEFSQRYAIPTDTFATVLPDLRRQDHDNRQNSIDDLENETQQYYEQRIDDHFREAVRLYESLLHSGVARECARSVLPINTVTRLYMSGTIRSWLHYVDLRGDNGTQAEHMKIARSVGEILDTEVPIIARAMWG